MKGIKRQFSVARTPQQNGVAERNNRTLIEAAKTMLADLQLPIPFWAEAINTSYYAQNRVLVTKPHNKTPYELLLGKFDGKVDEGFLVGYSVNSKAFRVFNSRTRIVQETLHINFLENKPNVAGIGPKWLFDIDTLTQSMNYQPVVARNQPNDNAGIKENLDAGKVRKETISAQQYMLLPLWSTGSQDPQNTNADVAFDVKENEKVVYVSPSGSDKPKKHDDKAKRDDKGKIHVDSPTGVKDLRAEFEECSLNSTNRVNAVSAPVTAAGPNPTNSTNSFNIASPFDTAVSLNFGIARKSSFMDPFKYPDDPDMPELEDIVYSDDEEDVGVETDLSNLETHITVSPILTTRVYKYHHVTQIISDLTSAPQKRSMTRMVKEQSGLHQINDEDFHTYVKSASTPIETEKPLLKDPDGEDVDVHIYRYLKGKPHLGLWYPRDSPFNLVAYSNIDYARASLDRKSTTRGCQFLGCRLISWQCKKQIVVATSLIKAKYVVVTSCCAQVLWIQNQLLDYGKELASPKQTALGKDISTPFMAGSLPKTKWHFLTAVSYKLMLFGLTKDVAVTLMLLVAPLTFTDTHNMVAFISKSDTSAGFDQIVDFLNAHVIQYALMVNPTIYVSCIKQFWATATLKKVNDDVQLCALIDEKKVVVTEDVIRNDLHLDDADGVECLPNKEIFVELARMGYEKPPPKFTFYKAFFSAQWKFLVHTLVQCISAKRTAWNEFSCSIASAVICLATGRKFNFSKYIFDSMVRNVDSPSKFLMYLWFQQVVINNQVDDLTSHNTKYTSHALTQKVAEEEEDVEVPNDPTPPSPTPSPSPPPQDPTPTPHATPHASPTQEQPTETSKSFVPLLNTLLETYATLSQKGRIDQQDVSAATKDVNAAEPTIFDDEEVTMTMAQTLIKMKAEKAKLLDEQIAKRLHDEEVKKAAAREKQEKDDLERVQVLQKQKYENLKRKQVSIDQDRKNMIIYLKNMVRYKMEHFRGMTYDKVRPIFEREYKKVQTLFKPDKDVEEPQKKRVAEKTLLHESFKKLKAVEVSGSESTQETPTNDPKEMYE
nr:hypothetical protein [Tanacetum cinerariifolium]